MKRALKRQSWLIMAMAIVPSWVYADVSFELGGASTYSKPTTAGIPAAYTFTSKLGLAGGVARLGFSFASSSEVVAGVGYLPLKFNDGSNDMLSHSLEMSLGFRHWIGQSVAVTVGGFYGLGLDLSSGSSTITFDNYGIKKGEVGALASLTLKFHLGGSTAIFWENSFAYGITNLAVNSSETFKYNYWMSALGLHFGKGGK